VALKFVLLIKSVENKIAI